MDWWFDRPLLKALTLGWDDAAINKYFEHIRSEQEKIPDSIMTSMQNIDAKVTALLTHVSRRELYILCVRATTFITICLLISLPAMYFW